MVKCCAEFITIAGHAGFSSKYKVAGKISKCIVHMCTLHKQYPSILFKEDFNIAVKNNDSAITLGNLYFLVQVFIMHFLY